MKQSPRESSVLVAESRHVWIEAVKSADIARIATIFCDDVVMMPPNETSLYGKEEALEWWREYFEYFKVTVLNGTESDIEVTGDRAIELWTYMIAIDPVQGGERIRDDGRSLTVWKLEADRVWRVSQTIWNSIRPIGSGTSRYLSRLKQT